MRNASSVPSSVADAAEAAEDEQLSTWLRRLRFLRVEHLAISPEFRSLQPWNAAQQELARVSSYKTPRDKLVCILNCCKRINSALSQASSGGHGADASAVRLRRTPPTKKPSRVPHLKKNRTFSTFSDVSDISCVFGRFWAFLDVFGRFWTFGAIFIRGAIFIIDPLTGL